jgi:hypothetical protein
VKSSHRAKLTKSLLDPSFRYVNAANTDVRRTFDRVRWERARAGQAERRVRIPTLVVDRIAAVPKR